MKEIEKLGEELKTVFNRKENQSNKNISNGYAGIDANYRIDENLLPKILYRSKSTILNRYYSSPSTGTALTTAALSANTLYAMPFFVDRKATIDGIRINVTTSRNGSSLRVGIYNDDGSLYPSTLLVDAGTQSSASTGVKSFISGIPLNIESGVYWLVCVTNSNPTIRGFTVAGLVPVLGIDANLGTSPGFGYSAPFTYAALPVSFILSATILTASPLPYIGVRLA